MIGRKLKSLVRAAVNQLGWLARLIGIISGKEDLRFRFLMAKQHDPMIDRHMGKAHQVDNGNRPRPKGFEQLLRNVSLMPPRNGKNHPPMAAQGVGLPRSPALRFDQSFLSLAEGAQAGCAAAAGVEGDGVSGRGV